MRGDPPIDDEVVRQALAAWSGTFGDLDYQRVGFGSWRWLTVTATGQRVFVTADSVRSAGNLPLDALRRAFAVPLALARAGHAFARPPIPTAGGDVAAAVGDRFALSVWPYVDGRANRGGEYNDADDRAAVLDVLRVLHDRGLEAAAAANPMTETFLVRHRDFLEVALDGVEGWDRGPFAARARALLESSANGVRSLLRQYDHLVAEAPPPSEWVLTHGEPHAANVVFTGGGPVLIDWDTALVAPKERDLRMVDEEAEGDPRLVRLYKLQWALEEIGGYLHLFHTKHGDTADTQASWEDLNTYLPPR